MLAFIYISLIQKESNIFKNTIWNSYRGRKQAKKELPDGIPDHIYCFPEKYGGTKCGSQLEAGHLDEVAKLSNVHEGTDDYLDPPLREECERIIPNLQDIEHRDASNAFIFLKTNFNETKH